MLLMTVASVLVGFLLALRISVWALVPVLGLGPIWLLVGVLAGYSTTSVLIDTVVYCCALSAGFFVGGLVRTREKGRNPISRFAKSSIDLRGPKHEPQSDVSKVV